MSTDKDTQLIWENYFQEKNKKPDRDGDGVPDWADKHDGEDDHEEKKVDEAKHDQNNDGKNDFEDVKIARMKASGMDEHEAIKKASGGKQVHEELDASDMGQNYQTWLLEQRDKMVSEGADADEAGESLLGSSFETMYTEYLRSHGMSLPHEAGEAHQKVAEYLNVPHQVDLNSLQKFKHR